MKRFLHSNFLLSLLINHLSLISDAYKANFLDLHFSNYYSIALKDAEKAKRLMNAHIIRIREQMAAATQESIGDDAKIGFYQNEKDHHRNAEGDK